MRRREINGRDDPRRTSCALRRISQKLKGALKLESEQRRVDVVGRTFASDEWCRL